MSGALENARRIAKAEAIKNRDAFLRSPYPRKARRLPIKAVKISNARNRYVAKELPIVENIDGQWQALVLCSDRQPIVGEIMQCQYDRRTGDMLIVDLIWTKRDRVMARLKSLRLAHR